MFYFVVKFNNAGIGTEPEEQHLEIMTPQNDLYPANDLYPQPPVYATKPDDPTADDYDFGGWYTDQLYQKKFDFSAPVTSHITLYARWIRTAPYWFKDRIDEKYTYVRVDPVTWQEHETYDFIKKGSVEMASTAEQKVTGSFEFEGYELPAESDLMRVYYSFRERSGLSASVPIATLFTSYDDKTYVDTMKDVKVSGNLDGYSVLKVLEEDKSPGMPVTFKKNSNAVYEAEQLIRQHGLQTNAEPSAFALSADHTFNAGTDHLEMVNWLLEAAGYEEAFPDAYGVVQLISKASISGKDVAKTFANNEESIMYPEVVSNNARMTAPNVVRLLYNTDDACIVAWAKNERGSAASIDARGREITQFEEIGELGEGASKANALMEQAISKLEELSSDTEYVEFQHAYVPISLFDKIKINYADMEWVGLADNIKIDLSVSTKTQTKAKRVISENIEVTAGSDTYREDS